MEGEINVDGGLGRGLKKRTSKRLGQVLSLLCRHLSLFVEITLVAHEDERNSIDLFDIENLLSEGWDLVKGRPRGDGVNEEESFSGSHVFIAQESRILVRRLLKKLQHAGFIINGDLLDGDVIDCRVIVFGKKFVDKLMHERSLSHFPSSCEDDLVFWHSLMIWVWKC